MRRLLVVACLALLVLLPAGLAHATYPGENGRIAFVNSGAISTMNPDGSGVVAVTTGTDPTWSPDGTRIGFVRSGGLWFANADGSSSQQIPGVSSNFGPTWSPDGSAVAFSSGSLTCCPFPHIFRANLDGTGVQQLSGSDPGDPDINAGHDPSWSPTGVRIAYQAVGVFVQDEEEHIGNVGVWTVLASGGGEEGLGGTTTNHFDHTYLDWSPDGSKVAFSGPASESCHPDEGCSGSGPNEIWIVNADGTGAVNLTSSAANDIMPAWSPDGTKIAFSSATSGQDHEIYTMNASGSGVVPLTDNATDDYWPSWQPVQRPHARPRGATPFRVSLVPAAKPCTSPNRQHGPPLAFPSCNPPQPESPNATVSQGDARLRSVGSVRMDVLAGPPGGPDDSDVQIRFSLTNVMNGSDFSDYTDALTASTGVRRTDRDAGQNSTTQDFDFAYPVACSPTADTFLGSTCAATTSFDAIVPGSAAEGSRAIWALERLEVYDGQGFLFATQGVFVP